MHSTNDEIVYPQQTEEMSRDLAANKVPQQLVLVQGGGHGFGSPGDSPDEGDIADEVVQFFVEIFVLHEPVWSN